MTSGTQPDQLGRPHTTELAQFIKTIQFDELSSKVIQIIKHCILDSIGTAVAGSTTPASRMVRQVVAGRSSIQGESTIIGGGRKISCVDAALLNSTSAHSIEMDDFHNKGGVHPAVAVIPAALSVAEKHQSSGSELLAAVLVGYEAMCRVGIATCVGQLERGFHPTATCGVFGAAAAAGRLWNLDISALANAFGIAGSFAGGLREWKAAGALTKPLQVGRASQNGVLATILASVGYTGPTTVIEGEMGFCRAYAYGSEGSLAEAFAELGQVFEIEHISFKPFASCRHTHPAIDGVLQLKVQQNFEIGEIEDILVKITKEMYRGVMWPEARKYKPETVTDAQFSLPYCVSAALSRGNVLLTEFTQESISDPKLLELAGRVRAVVSPECEEVYPQLLRQIVEITLSNGKQYVRHVDYCKGEPENPMTKEEFEEKFIKLAAPVIGASQADRVVEIIDTLETQKKLDELYTLLAGDASTEG
ncbi:MAG: MmgE/PrpD family protein [Pseudomonadota bacterium]